MSRIDGLSEVMALLGRELQRSGRSRLSKKESTSRANAGETLEQRLVDRLQPITQHDADSDKKRVRIFLETVITWEFGDELMQDPRFHDMIAKIADTMRGDHQLQIKLARFFHSLSR